MPIKTIRKGVNYVKSLPTRRAAMKEYRENMYDTVRVGTQLYSTPKKNPITYNKASTGIRKKK